MGAPRRLHSTSLQALLHPAPPPWCIQQASCLTHHVGTVVWELTKPPHVSVMLHTLQELSPSQARPLRDNILSVSTQRVRKLMHNIEAL